MSLKVKQINEYLFSDTVQSKKNNNKKAVVRKAKVNTRDIRPCSLGQVKTKVVKENERDRVFSFCEWELERWQEVM